MARITYSFKETAIDAISLAGRTRLGRVQSSDVGNNLPNTPVQELGSNQLVGRIYDLPEVTVSVSSIDVGPRTAFMLAGVDWDAAPSGTRIEAQDIRYVCLVQSFKAEAGNDIARTLFIPGAKLDSLSMNYSVGGDATEDYSFQATSTKWLKHDVAIASGVVAGGQIALSSARQLKDGKFYLAAFSNRGGYLPADAVTTSTASSVSFDPNQVENGDFVVVAYHTDAVDQWVYTQDYAEISGKQAVGVRGWGVEVYLTKTGSTDQRVYRAQSCTVQSQLQTNRVQELGSEVVVGYSDGIPEVTGTIELMQHDFRLHEILSGAEASDDNFDPSELGSGDWGLLIKVFRRGVDRAVYGPEKTIWIPVIDVTQENSRAQVGQDITQTFNWASRTGEVFIYKGNRPA